jgi:hypothetical protein
MFVSTAVTESPLRLQNKNIIGNKPFLHTAFVSLLRQELSKNAASFGVEFHEYFTSSLADQTEPEMPMLLVALVATCVQPQTIFLLYCY